ncbi:MAG: ABC transporter permease [Actinomycetota bacterium]|nr:ABC transporter permease [Actinomycetota bacterium]
MGGRMRRSLVILRKELKDTVRDRRTLVTMVLVPVLLMPLILIGTVKLQEWSMRSHAEDVVELAVTGAEYAPGLMDKLASDGKIEVAGASGDAVAMLKDGEIDGHLIIPSDFEERIVAGEGSAVTMQANSTKDNSAAAVDKVALIVDDYSEDVVAERLRDLELDTGVLNGVVLVPEDTATEKEKGGTFLAYLLPMFLVIFALVGGMYTAMDISAGEKERKTLEALLMTPASRTEIVTGKFLAVATIAVITIVLSVGAIFVTAPMMASSLGAVDVSLDAATALIMLPIAVLLAAMFAALLLAVSIFARSYKEAQNYVTPLYLLAVLPVIVANVVPSGGSDALFVIPGFSAVVLFRELLMDEFILSHILVTAATTIIYTALSIRWAAAIYSRGDVLVDEGGGPGKAFSPLAMLRRRRR